MFSVWCTSRCQAVLSAYGARVGVKLSFQRVMNPHTNILSNGSFLVNPVLLINFVANDGFTCKK